MKDKSETREYRHFGLLVGGIFIIIGVLPAVFKGQSPRLWALIVGGILILPGLLMPRSLAPIYKVWMAVSKALEWFSSRLILGAIYYLLFAPAGLLFRLLGRDSMQRGRESDAPTYRMSRQPRPSSHIRHQF